VVSLQFGEGSGEEVVWLRHDKDVRSSSQARVPTRAQMDSA
jgi:hypothetical protein